jgi:hypothetical protein
MTKQLAKMIMSDLNCKPVLWLLSGLLMTAGTAHAQAHGRDTRQPADLSAHEAGDAKAYEKLLQDAARLVKNGNPAEAYALLEPLEFDHAGEVRFDYLIGIAALDSGIPDKATMAFERVLAVNPNHAAARLDMARAYYQLGDFPRARTEFTIALNQNPSATLLANIQKYLDAIDAQQAGKRTRFSAYVEGGLGRDSNINISTSQSQLFVDAFATVVQLNPSNVKMADNYYALAAGGKINHELNAHWGLFAGGGLRKRNNNTHAEFNSINTDVRGGVVYAAKADRLNVSLVGGQYDLDGARNSDIVGFKGEWRHVLSPSNQLNAFAQAVKYRYADPLLQPNDVNQQALGLGWLHVLADGKATLSGSTHYGTEKDVAPIITVPGIGVINPSGGRNDGARHFGGLRVGGQTAYGEKTTLFASASMQPSDYDKVNYLFLRKRKDRLYDLKLGADWHWDKLWTLRPQLSYYRNDSNIDIYSYDRTDVSLTVRRDFR